MDPGAPRADQSCHPARCHPMARTGDRRPTARLDTVMSESGSKTAAAQDHPRSQYWPLYAAGFVTAFGAHSIAANLGAYGREHHATLLTVGLLLAIYDGAEFILKPVFGALVDRVGPRPVLLGGLVGFAAASAAFVIAGDPGLLAVARFGQGAAVAAFSPAASTLVSRLTPTGGHGRRFGSYGAWKGLGYTLGPLVGGALVTLGGFTLLFSALCGLAYCVAMWAVWVVPRVAPLPRRRSTVVELARRGPARVPVSHCGSRGFDSSVVRRRRLSPGPWGGLGHERVRHRSRCVNPFGLRRPCSAVGRSCIGQQAVELPGGLRRWALVVCSRIHRCRNDSRSGRIARLRHRHRFGCGCTHATRVCFSRRFRACRTTRRNAGGGRSRPRTR